MVALYIAKTGHITTIPLEERRSVTADWYVNQCLCKVLHAVRTRGRGHDGLVNCVRTGMSKSVSISKTVVAANAIYSHKSAGHDALLSAFVATCEDSQVIFSVVGISRNR